MSQIIDGKKLAEEIKDKITKQIFDLKGPRPNLAIILIGERPDSELYVKIKEEEAVKVGIDTHLYACPENIPESDVLAMIEHLNKDEMIDGILIQLPLPAGFNTDKIIQSLDPKKDVDCFHPDNLKKAFASCHSTALMSPVFKTVSRMLCSIDCNLENKNVCVVCNSDVFGGSLAKTLECYGAKTEIVYADKFDEAKTRQADILITAIGKPNFIKKEMIKEDAVIIDIGTTKVGKKVVGDVDFEDVEKKVSYITPVPGGVGPMTVAYLFENCMEVFKKRRGE
ncbi:MAG: bifunctional 5,10-methylenetetrahydrofolate dehydrogenase/5,10-methenyltetrahydrofolate cyclohydrolase [Candidatus Magasanikbacteria bacterium]|nr:bifunctional 5,10-methylenetetrahydrofolate dehydrogenase/5,10-methenyltetrahydrofolate cyclohydrolase [Candidatus Magasanikbacteria bacterium]